jgi:membrane-associated protease RseP (regulator of RpoE activity)
MLPRYSLPLLMTLVAAWPMTAGAQNTRETVVETKESTRDADGQKALSERLGWELATADDGVRIERITKNSPVAEAHLEEKDIIKKIAGENIATAERVTAVLTDLRKKGETKTDVVVLRDGEELSYLLSLEDLDQATGVRSTQTTIRGSDQDLVAMIQQLQLQSEQQQVMLQTLLTEVQTLRTQLGLPANARVNPAVPPGTQFNGDIVAPLGTAGVPNNQSGVPANNNGAQTQPPVRGNRR